MQVEKFGDPNGIIEFAGAATSMRELEEPAGTQLQELGFPVVRQAGTGITGVLKVWCFPLPFGLSRCCTFPFPVGPQGAALSPFLWVLKVQCFPFLVGPQGTVFPFSCGSSRYSDFPFPVGPQGTVFPFPVGPQGTAFPFSYGSSRYSVSHFPFWPSANPVLALGGVLWVEHLLLQDLALVCWYGTGGIPTTATNASLALV